MDNHNATEQFKSIYFVGAGGIGMAALERYFLFRRYPVAGYDRTPSALTDALAREGVEITFTDDPDSIPAAFRDPSLTLVVYTPAVPDSNRILSFFRSGGFTIVKRARLLGMITRSTESICVAGSHGKTTTSSMIAHILNSSAIGCNAFLGGILRNVGSNLVTSADSPYSVVEADEYDRSFHQLFPTLAVITSTDPDHLDIYGNEDNYLESFAHFTELIRPGGTLFLHTGLKLIPRTNEQVEVLTYSGSDESADCHAENITYGLGSLSFDYVGPDIRISNISLGVPVEINIDNAVAAIAVALKAGATPQEIVDSMASFRGAHRRFEIHHDASAQGGSVLIDDYAHSPNEIRASIRSVRKLWPGRSVTVVFQPHLYSRTRDFAAEFASALSEADRVLLLEIYPARELPIPVVDSRIIFDRLTCAKKELCLRKDLPDHIKSSNFEILMTLGAADIDRELPEIKRILTGN